MIFPKIPFVLLCVSGAAFYWRRRPTLPPAVFLFIASVFLSRIYWSVAGTTIRFEQLTAMLLFTCFSLDLLRRRICLRLPWQAFLVLALFPLMLLSSFLASPLPWISVKKSMLYLPYFLAFLAMTHYLFSAEKLEEAWRAFYVFGAAAVIMSVVGFYLIYLGLDLGMVRSEYGSLWLRGTMTVANIMGSTAALVFLAALIRLTADDPGREKKRGADLAVLAVSVAAVMMSYSRGAWLGALLGMILVAGLRRRQLLLRSSSIALLVMVGSGVLVSFTTAQSRGLTLEEKSGISLGEFGEAEMDAILRHPSAFKPRGVSYFQKVKALLQIEGHDQWRFQVIGDALKDWRLSPFIGRGTDSLPLKNKPSHPLDKFRYYIPMAWLAFLHDWGLIGLLLYGAFLLAAWLQLAGMLRPPVAEKRRELALVLLLVLLASTFMYQVSTAMQLSIFWCLWSFYMAAISLKTWPAVAASPR